MNLAMDNTTLQKYIKHLTMVSNSNLIFLDKDHHQLYGPKSVIECIPCFLKKRDITLSSSILCCSCGGQFLVSHIYDDMIPIIIALLGPFRITNDIHCPKAVQFRDVSRDNLEALGTTLSAYTAMISQQQLFIPPDDNFNKISSYIKHHIHEDLSVEHLKSYLLIPRNTLFRVIKDATSMSLGDYIKAMRLEYALELLKSTEHSIAQIAELCGIPDCNYFSRLFKKTYGVSPTDYRRASRPI